MPRLRNWRKFSTPLIFLRSNLTIDGKLGRKILKTHSRPTSMVLLISLAPCSQSYVLRARAHYFSWALKLHGILILVQQHTVHQSLLLKVCISLPLWSLSIHISCCNAQFRLTIYNRRRGVPIQGTRNICTRPQGFDRWGEYRSRSRILPLQTTKSFWLRENIHQGYVFFLEWIAFLARGFTPKLYTLKFWHWDSDW